ncbi:MAG: hypothetical protein ACK2UJ_08690 [Candidatus Promineifilaceae bacterium]
MRNEEVKQNAVEKSHADRAPYEPPAIIYEGLITTRAATPPNSGSESSSASESGASPENIFSSDN